MSNLLHQKCHALEGGQPMGDATIHDHLAQVSGWHLNQGAIEKTYSFKNYYETMAFVNALAWISHREDHHPDLLVGYNKCRVEYSTHAIGGLHENDFIMASKINSLSS